MCGLFGYQGKELPDYSKLKLLAIDAQNRGRDSTGVYGSKLFKTTDEPIKAVYAKEFSEAIRSQTVLGHSRNATSGAKTIENAHPFIFEENGHKVVGTHNGWLIEHEWQAHTLGMDDVVVDSMLIFKAFIKRLDFSKIVSLHGAMAIAFILDDKRLYLYRRSSKPLFIAQTDDGLYYSSRQDGLYLCGFNDIMSLPTDQFFGFENGRLVDHRFHGFPEIELPLDSTPGRWRLDAGDSATKKIPHAGEIYNILKSKKGEVRQVPFPLSLPEAKKEKPKESKNGSKEGIDVEKFSKEFLNLENLYNEIVINSGSLKTCGTSDSEKTHIAIKLTSAESDSPLISWAVFLSSVDNSLAYTNDVGIALISIPKVKWLYQEMRLIVVPDGSKESFYSKKIVFNAGSTIEIKMSLSPFPKSAEDEDNNKPAVKRFETEDAEHEAAVAFIADLLLYKPEEESIFLGGETYVKPSELNWNINPLVSGFIADDIIAHNKERDAKFLLEEIKLAVNKLETTGFYGEMELIELEDIVRASRLLVMSEILNFIKDEFKNFLDTPIKSHRWDISYKNTSKAIIQFLEDNKDKAVKMALSFCASDKIKNEFMNLSDDEDDNDFPPDDPPFDADTRVEDLKSFVAYDRGNNTAYVSNDYDSNVVLSMIQKISADEIYLLWSNEPKTKSEDSKFLSEIEDLRQFSQTIMKSFDSLSKEVSSLAKKKTWGKLNLNVQDIKTRLIDKISNSVSVLTIVSNGISYFDDEDRSSVIEAFEAMSKTMEEAYSILTELESDIVRLIVEKEVSTKKK